MTMTMTAYQPRHARTPVKKGTMIMRTHTRTRDRKGAAGMRTMRTMRKKLLLLAAGVAVLAAGITAGMALHNPGPQVITRVAYQPVPGPVKTITKTITKTVAPPPPPPGTQIGSWSGTGNQVTPAFNAPVSGTYVVSWTFYGNTDGAGGPGNFIVNDNDQETESDLPNAIATSGSGSTEVSGASGVESFNVQATGSWTITVKTVP